MSYLAALAKKGIIYLLTDTEKAIKIVFFFIFIPIFVFVMLFGTSFKMTTSTPAAILDENLDGINLYQDAVISVNNSINEWIEANRKKYTDEDFFVSYNLNLDWQILMSIDAVRYNQDFSKVKSKDIIKLANKFIIKTTKKKKYKEKVPVTYKEKVRKRYVDQDGITHFYEETVTKKRYKTVTKEKLFINVESKSKEEIFKELKFDETDISICNNMIEVLSVLDTEGNLNIYDDIDLSNLKEYPPGDANIIYFNQSDKRWGYSSYGNSTIKKGGCGPTSLAMVIYSLTGNNKINPKVMADWSVKNGCRAEGAGSYWTLFTKGGKAFGLNVEAVSRKNPKKIVEALSKGNPVIVSMGRGHFTKGGHFIVLRGITKDGKILVNDPASITRTKKAWDLSIIMSESSKIGGINGSPFWIFKRR